MDLKNVQDLFVRMAVDSRFREAALTGPDHATGVFAGLEEEMRKQARSLISKRKGAVRGLLKGACAWLGPAFDDEFANYARDRPEPQGVHRHRLDALEFASWITQRVEEKCYPPALTDLLSHETAPLLMWVEGRRSLLRFLWRHPVDLSNRAREGPHPANGPVRPTIVFWRTTRNAAEGFRWNAFSLW